jgi:hypothetical protein
MGELEEPVVVFESASPVEIDMAQQILAAAGIPHATSELSTSAMQALGGESFAGVRVVQVPGEFADAALAALEAAWGKSEESGEA